MKQSNGQSSEEEETKIKDPYAQPANFKSSESNLCSLFQHYIPKGEELKLIVRELDILCSGDYEKIRALLKGYSQKWNVNLEDANPTLFSHLSDE